MEIGWRVHYITFVIKYIRNDVMLEKSESKIKIMVVSINTLARFYTPLSNDDIMQLHKIATALQSGDTNLEGSSNRNCRL